MEGDFDGVDFKNSKIEQKSHPRFTANSVPAYSTVNTRRSFNNPNLSTRNMHSAAPPSLSSLTMEGGHSSTVQPSPPLPKSAEDYVYRTFQYFQGHESNQKDRIAAENKLREILEAAVKNNTITKVDWDHYPLPQDIIRQENLTLSSQKFRTQGVSTNSDAVPFPNRSKKRKSTDTSFTNSSNDATTHGDVSENVPSKKRKSKKARKKEKEAIKRAEQQQQNVDQLSNNTNTFEEALQRRAARFGTGNSTSHPLGPSRSQSPVSTPPKISTQLIDRISFQSHTNNDQTMYQFHSSSPFQASVQHIDTTMYSNSQLPIGQSFYSFAPQPIVGRCMQWEKSYFRLTDVANPKSVRPLPILREAFKQLKLRDDRDYGYLADQYKSIRQDLNVQNIKNEFTLEIYEYNTCLALQHDDLGEYNQCAAQLPALYSKFPGPRKIEFISYRILYLVYTLNLHEVCDLINELTQEELSSWPVQHALAVWRVAHNPIYDGSGNYRDLFILYRFRPAHLQVRLMDMFLERERLLATEKICKSFRPEVPITFLAKVLGFRRSLCVANDDTIYYTPEIRKLLLHPPDKALCRPAEAPPTWAQLLEMTDEVKKWLVHHGAEDYLSVKNDETYLDILKYKNDATKPHAFTIFRTARMAAFKTIDIKGQRA
ncbi:hypothetical protein M501DRAFT_1020980 [Patellaria atrata CBS 101060]|uniref:SAC3/GANP/THP3 conserved domain-containing protein n=1 Tax=Patellaria atrata CBS 101060 TaxID=1346257 RepID=A0A9P4S0W8_9PEZI|nr:hypothetical protein M501DRAFT_1020980 [Patellaria atrata CBS 101060]